MYCVLRNSDMLFMNLSNIRVIKIFDELDDAAKYIIDKFMEYIYSNENKSNKIDIVIHNLASASNILGIYNKNEYDPTCPENVDEIFSLCGINVNYKKIYSNKNNFINIFTNEIEQKFKEKLFHSLKISRELYFNRNYYTIKEIME